jgi:hypothetical protein
MKMDSVKSFHVSYLKNEIEEYYRTYLSYPSSRKELNKFLESNSSRTELLEYMLAVKYSIKHSNDTLEIYSTGFNGVDNGGKYIIENYNFIKSIFGGYDIPLLKMPIKNQIDLIRTIATYKNGSSFIVEPWEKDEVIKSLDSLLNNYYHRRFGVTIKKDALRAVAKDQFLIEIKRVDEGSFIYSIVGNCNCQIDLLDFSILELSLNTISSSFEVMYLPVTADLSKVIKI